MIKKILLGLILICLAFFLLGFLAVQVGLLAQGTYFTIASIAGGIASVIGLLSLARPSISPGDLETIEVDRLAKLAQLAAEIRNAQEKKDATREEIAELEAKREAMQVLVRKASLSLFLHDRVEKNHTRLLELLDRDSDLTGTLEDYRKDVEKLRTLGEEIEADENVEVLMEVLAEAHARREGPHDQVDYIFGILERLTGKLIGGVLRH